RRATSSTRTRGARRPGVGWTGRSPHCVTPASRLTAASTAAAPPAPAGAPPPRGTAARGTSPRAPRRRPARRAGRWAARSARREIRKAAGNRPVEHVVADVAAATGATNVLVVANETVISQPLLDAIRQRAAQGPGSFLIVCPQSDPRGTEHAHPDAERRLRA